MARNLLDFASKIKAALNDDEGLFRKGKFTSLTNASQNLQDWKKVATTPSLRQDFSQFVAKPAIQKYQQFDEGLKQKQKAQLSYYRGGEKPERTPSPIFTKIGQGLQDFKLPEFTAPTDSGKNIFSQALADRARLGQQAYKKVKPFAQEELRAKGELAEKVGKGEKLSGWNILDASDFMTAGVASKVVKIPLKARKILANKEIIEKTVKAIDSFHVFKKFPTNQMDKLRVINGVFDELLPKVAKSKDLAKLQANSPDRWMKVVKEYLVDALDIAENPIKDLKLGGSIKKVSRGDSALARATTEAKPPTGGVGGATRIKGTFQDHFSKFIADKELSKTVSTQKSTKLAKIPSEIAQEVIDVREGVKTSKNKLVNKYASDLKHEFDTAYGEAKTTLDKAGLSIGYLDNYTPHYWKESVEQVQEAFLRIKKTLKEAKPRTIPTYKEGIELGLTPKYTHPAQLQEAYIANLEQFKSSMEFFNNLKADGIISKTRKEGFVPIIAEGLGRTSRIVGEGVEIIDNWYAPRDVANQITKLFNPVDPGKLGRTLEKTAKASGAIQDIALSGGVPGTPINAFTIAQSQKEVLSGRLKSPLKAFFESVSPERTAKFFSDNVEQIKKMQERNVTIRSSYNVSELIDTKLTDKIFGGGVKQAWHKLVNEPTFGRFMPMLQVNLFNDIEAKALKNGLAESKAADLAADAVSNFYGLTNTAKQAMRDKQLSDLGTTALFAPRYRESMVNFWVNIVKGMKDPLSPKNITNSKFAVGAIITYIVMDQINRAKNGHGMQDNPTWKKDKLLIPMEGGFTLGVPFLSSIATVPRGLVRIGSTLAKGDLAGTASETFRTFASMGIKPLGEITSNEDYFGREIYSEDDNAGTKLVKQVGHIFKSINHPYVREFIELYTKPDKPLAQRLSMAMELPFRFYKTEGIENAPFWDRYHELKAVNEKYTEMKKTNPTGAEGYLSENETGIDEFNILRGYLTEYYDEIDSQGESDVLKNAPANFRGIDPTLIKDDKRFEISEDAPKTNADKVRLYIKSAFVDMGGTVEAASGKEPFRKIRGGELVTERRTDISAIDVGKKGVQVDHRIPKWAGGRDTVENYQALSDVDHKAKTSFEYALRMKVEDGKMSQEKARKEIEQWHTDNKIKPVSLTKSEIGIVESEVEPTKGMEVYKSGEGVSVEDRAKWVAKQLEGKSPEETKELISKFWDGKVITKGANGVATYLEEELGINVWKSTGTSSGSGSTKKLKKISIKKTTVSPVKISSIRRSSLPAFKLSKGPVSRSSGKIKVKDISLPEYKARKIQIKDIPQMRVAKGGFLG